MLELTTEAETVGIPAPDDYNGWADYWFHVIGANVIPADSLNKRPIVEWKGYQNISISEEQHRKWKDEGMFNRGFAVVMGKLWRGRMTGWCIGGIDLDGELAIKEFYTENGKIYHWEEFTLVEERESRQHVYVCSDTPLHAKSSDMSTKGFEIEACKIPAIEVKGSSKFLMFPTPNINKNGSRYQIKGLREPVFLNKDRKAILEDIIDKICKRYGLKYLNYQNGNGPVPISELCSGKTPIPKGNNRHEGMLRVIASLVIRNYGVIPLETIKKWCMDLNVNAVCQERLSNKEFEELWHQTLRWAPVRERVKQVDDKKSTQVQETGITLEANQVQDICQVISSWCCSDIVVTICLFLNKQEYAFSTITRLVENVFINENERQLRIKEIQNKSEGVEYLFNVLKDVIGDERIASKTLSQIITILVGKENTIDWLVHVLRRENIFVTMKDTHEILYYSGGVYVSGGDLLIRNKLRILCPTITIRGVKEVISRIEDWTFKHRSEFDNIDDDYSLHLKNGILNIDTGELTAHYPKYLSLSTLPVSYNPDAKCPKILNFLEAVCPDDVNRVLRMIGYCLYKSCRFDKAFLLFGNGANGKGTLIRIIEAMFGPENCSHRSIQDLDQEKHATADLFGKYVNTFADLPATRFKETSKFKMMVSGDSVMGERKFQHPFSFRNRAKFICSANKIPQSEDKTNAFYRRWEIIHFDNSFEGFEDTELEEKLTTPEELSGLLNLALNGLKELKAMRGFRDKTTEQRREEYEQADDVDAFVSKECIIDIKNTKCFTPTTKVYGKYVEYCTTKNRRPLNPATFGKRLSAYGLCNAQHMIDGVREYCYEGLMLQEQLTRN